MRPILFYMTSVLVAVADQVSKFAILQRVPDGLGVRVLGNWLWLTHVQNAGGAFSIVQADWRIFLVIATAAICALAYAYHKYQRGKLAVSAALALALGGAIGNVIDRARPPHTVVDFFDIRFHGHNIWPVFNIADSAITIAIFVLAWHFIFSKPSPDLPAKSVPGGEVGVHKRH